MAHFAKVNSDNTVEQVCVVNNTEAVSGQEFLNSLGLSGTWIQTSYNTRSNVHILGGTPLRGNYAGIGYVYDSVNDVFYPPRRYASWTISADTNWVWTPPIPLPKDGNVYVWDESTTKWVAVSS